VVLRSIRFDSFLIDVAAHFVVKDGEVSKRPKAPNVLPIVLEKAHKPKWRKRPKRSPYEKLRDVVEKDGEKANPEDSDYDYERGEFFLIKFATVP